MSRIKEAVIEPIQRNRAFEQVSRQLKNMIIDGVYKSGDRLPPESELASRFGVGRQTVREAMRILELSGFIVIQKGGGGGAVVMDSIASSISNLFLENFQLEKTSMEELTIARFEIERVVLRYAAANADEEDIRALRQNVADAQVKSDANQVILDENIRFHQLLAKASKNNLFVIVVEAITATLRHCMSQILLNPAPDVNLLHNDNRMRSINALKYHKAIIEAIQERNGEKGVAILEAHLLEVKNRLMSIMGQAPGKTNTRDSDGEQEKRQ